MLNRPTAYVLTTMTSECSFPTTHRLAAAISLLTAAVLAAGSASAQMPQPGDTGVVGVRLLSGWHEADGALVAAIRIELAPGWHTYWRIPGDTGIPPQFDWSQSENLAAVSYQWPQPTIFDRNGMRFYGYEDALVLPVRLVPNDPSEPVQIDVSMFLGVCKDICLPAEAEVSATLAGDFAESGRTEIEAALQSRALTPDEAGISDVRCSLAPGESGFDLTAELTFSRPLPARQIALFETSDPTLWIAPPESRVDGNRLLARAHVTPASGGNVLVDRDAIRLTVLDTRRAVDIRGCTAPG
jgi:DsbC/DsbD-like thiol-disulfide interchange protein